MGCSAGCGSSSGGCSSGCGKLDVHDWLGDMSRPMSPFDTVEVRFKGGRKEFYRNVYNLELYTGDIIVVEGQPGHHIGEITMQGEIVRLQLKKKKVQYNDDLKIIYRKAGQKDVEKFEQARNRELPTLYRTREIIRELNLDMKLSDVEYQADNSKASFYYSAEDRVDFRELIKLLASEFKIRIEMRQISLRQEASRLGGIGSCGRELCCSTWLTDFKNVSTSAARYQNLSLNPAKLSGQCGRLKCCLNYELDTYLDAIKSIPEINKPLLTEQGEARLQKTDIFKGLMWFGYKDETTWIPIRVDRVKEIIELNAAGETVYSLETDEEEVILDTEINSDLLDLDRKLKRKNQPEQRKKRKKNNSKNKRREPQTKNTNVEQKTKTPTNKKSSKPKRQNQVQKQQSNNPKPVVNKESSNKGGSNSNRPKRQNVGNKPKRENVTASKPKQNSPKPKAEKKESKTVTPAPTPKVEQPKAQGTKRFKRQNVTKTKFVEGKKDDQKGKD